MERPRLSWPQVGAAPASAHLLVCMGQPHLLRTQECWSRRDTLAHAALGVNGVPCSPRGMHRHRDRECGEPKLELPLSSQRGCNWLGSSSATSSDLPSSDQGGVVWASLLLKTEVSSFSCCLSSIEVQQTPRLSSWRDVTFEAINSTGSRYPCTE